MTSWIQSNRPVVAAIIAALTPVLIALATGDLQAALDGWPAAAEVIVPAVLAGLVGWVSGTVAQQGTTPWGKQDALEGEDILVEDATL